MSTGASGPPSAHPSPARVLHVDDDPEMLDLVALMLERDHPDLSVTTASSATAGLEALAEGEYECVVSDYDMPEMDGLGFLAAVRERHGDLPFVLFTGKGSEEIASEAISAGVTDYLQKGGGREQYAVLANRIENAVDRYRAERAVEATRQWHQRLVEESTDVILVADPDGRIRYASPSAEGVLGYDPGALVGANALEFVHPDDRARFKEAHSAIVGGDAGTPRVEFRCSNAAGAWITVESHSRNLEDDPTIEGIVVYVRDVSARRARERELARYERIVGAIGDGVYALDREGQLVEFNDCLVELTGYDREELVGASVAMWYDDEDVERFEHAIRELLSEEGDDVKTVEATLHRADGEAVVVEVNLTLLPAEDGEFHGTVGVIRDVTERSGRELELETYETLVEASGDAMYALDAEGRCTFANEAHESLTGYAAEELLGEHVSVRLRGEDVERGEAVIRALLADGDRRSDIIEMDVVTRDGRRIPCENHVAILPMEDGEFRGTVGVLRDISDREERERTLRRQNERLDRFASVLSHDLRNPLNVAVGRIQIERGEEDTENLARAEEALGRMADMIEDVLTLAREGGKVVDPDEVAFDRCVDAAWETIDAGTATLEASGDIGTILADERRLQQLLANLFQNGVDHAGPDPSIRVGRLGGDDSWAGEGSSIGEGSTTGEGSSPGFYVEDDGPGVPEADRRRVFEFGETAGSDGTGFGLAIVEEIAEAHGWTIEVTEGDAGGARFEVTGVEWIEPSRGPAID